MKELFGIPMDTLAAVLAVLVAIVAGSLGALAAAPPRPAQARNPQPRAPPRAVGADRGRAHAGDDHHRRRARDRRHDEPHHPCDRYSPVRRHRGDRGGQRSGRRHRGRAGSRDGHRLLPREHGREGPARPRRQASHRRRHGRDPGGRRAPGPDPAPDRAERHALRARSGGHGRVRADSQRARRHRHAGRAAARPGIPEQEGCRRAQGPRRRPDGRLCRREAGPDAHPRRRALQRRDDRGHRDAASASRSSAPLRQAGSREGNRSLEPRQR